MNHSRLVGGLTALAMLLILCAAPAAWAAPLPAVWSAGYAATTNDAFTAVATAQGGVVYAAGYAKAGASGHNGLLLLAKYVDTGTTSTREWVRTLQLNGVAADKLAVDSQGDVIVAATADLSASDSSSILVLKYSPTGVLKWRALYDGAVHRADYVNDLALDAHGNALVVGASVGKGTGRDFITLKIRADGSRAWARRYVGPEVFDEARGVAVDPRGNVYVTGWSNDKSRARRAQTISYGPSGVKRWAVRDTKPHTWSGAAAVMYSTVPEARSVVVSGYQGDRGKGYETLMFVKYRSADGKIIWKRTSASGATAEPSAAAIDGTGAPIAAGMSTVDGRTVAYIGGVSATGGDAWKSELASGFTNPGWAEFEDVAVNGGGAVLAGGWKQPAEPPKDLYDYVPSAFLVRYSPAWPITAPLDYVGAGSPTSKSKCMAVAIGPAGMYAVGQRTSEGGDLDAVLVKF